MKDKKGKKRISRKNVVLIMILIGAGLFLCALLGPGGSGEYDRYHGPVLPLTSLNGGEGVDVQRNVNFDFSPYQEGTQYTHVGIGGAKITDTYVFTNTTGEKQTLELVCGFLGQFIDRREEFPVITVDGMEIQPKLYPSVDTDELVWHSMDFERFQQILTENDFLTTALQQSEELDIPVTAYHFSELAYDGNEVAGVPMLTLRFSLEEDTTVWASQAHEHGTEDDGRTRMMFRVDHGDAWVFTFGGKLIDPEYGGNRDYNISKTSAIDGVTFQLETFETTLGKAIEELAQTYDFWSIEGLDTYPDPGYMTPEILVDGAVKRIHALGYLESSERIRMIGDLFSEVVTEPRMMYMVFPVELEAGQTVTVEAAYVQEPSLDIVSGSKYYRGGYELAAKLGSDLHFTALTSSISNTGFIDKIEQNFGFDPEAGITKVNLDLQTDRYYLEVKIKK